MRMNDPSGRLGSRGLRVMVPADPEGTPRSTAQLLERLEHPVDLVERVVVAEADPDRAAGLEQPEPVEDLDRVVVTVPREDASLGELARPCPAGAARRPGSRTSACARRADAGRRSRSAGRRGCADARRGTGRRSSRRCARTGEDRGSRSDRPRTQPSTRCTRSRRSFPPSPRGSACRSPSGPGSRPRRRSQLVRLPRLEDLAADADHPLVGSEELVRARSRRCRRRARGGRSSGAARSARRRARRVPPPPSRDGPARPPAGSSRPRWMRA